MPTVSRFFRRFSSKDQQASDYVEFDGIVEDGHEIESNQQRLQSIWRNDSRYQPKDITEHVQQQEYQPKVNKMEKTHYKCPQYHAARSTVVQDSERIINTKNQFNKVFASQFIAENIVTFGTKDNKLMLLDVVKGKICQIRLPNPEKSFDYNRSLDAVTDNNQENDKNCGIHDLRFNQNNNLLITGGHKPQDVALFKYDNDIHHVGPKKFSHNLVPLANLKFHKDWIFAMDFVDNEHIVAGGRDGQLSIWDISKIDQIYSNFREKHHLKLYKQDGFDDMLGINQDTTVNDSDFATSLPELEERLLSFEDGNGNNINGNSNNNHNDDWTIYNSDGTPVDQEHVMQLKEKQKTMTVSQDRCNVPILRKPIHFSTDKKHRIRALKAFSKSTSLSHSQCIVTLATTGEVQIFDVSRSKSLLKEFLPHRKEAVCVEINQDKGQIIVGSQSHIQMFDPRSSINRSLQVVDSLDKNWGCRTISCYTDLLTIGGGLGRLSFYDLRTNKYLTCGTKQKKSDTRGNDDKQINYRTIDKGWIKEDDVYNNIFALHGLPTPTAIYTHCYNPQRSKLFAAGGPTPYGLFGSAASVYF